MKTCPGVCVAERIADYCEAVINIAEMCKPGLKCCVSRDSFSNAEKPANFIILDRNTTTMKPHTTDGAASTTSTSLTVTTSTKTLLNAKQCQGECVNGLLALFCDDIDTNAFCPGEDSCCITNPVSSSASATHSTTYSQYSSSKAPSTYFTSTFSTTTPYVTKSTPSLPRCPGYCLLNIMAAFCERPSVLIPQTSTCKKGSVCCDNTRAATSQKPRPHITMTTTTTAATTTMASPPDPRSDCPGSCIVPYLSFTCFSEQISFYFY